MYKVNEQSCLGCAICVQACPKGVRMSNNGIAEIVDQDELERCGGASICPMGSILGEGHNSEGGQPQPQRPSPFVPGARPGVAPGRASMGSGMGRGGGQGMGRGGGQGMGSRGVGSGVGAGRTAGPSGVCVCPNCGNRETHRPGQPCYQMQCPVCGIRMRRA
jgi:ferredoxin